MPCTRSSGGTLTCTNTQTPERGDGRRSSKDALMQEHNLQDLSDLGYRVFTCDISERHRATAMVLEFSGVYRPVSAGIGDGEFMRCITLVSLSAWEAHGIVFDLRELSYEWGDNIWAMYGRAVRPSGLEDRPYVTIASEKSWPGLSTCTSIVGPVVWTLDDALKEITRRTQSFLDDLYAPFVSSG